MWSLSSTFLSHLGSSVMSTMDPLLCFTLLFLHKLLPFLLAHWRDSNQNYVDLQRSHFLYQKKQTKQAEVSAQHGRKGHIKSIYAVATPHCKEWKQCNKGQRSGTEKTKKKDAPQTWNRNGSYRTVDRAECGERRCASSEWWECHYWSTHSLYSVTIWSAASILHLLHAWPSSNRHVSFEAFPLSVLFI